MSKAIVEDKRKVTTHRLKEMKTREEKISMLTAYDYSMASIIDQAGMDVILVGDSASNVMAGNITTLPMTFDQIIYHGLSVMKAVHRALVVVDMPFDTCSGNPFLSLDAAIRIMKETGADTLKIEGGEITSKLSIPTIGIGAGPYVDGQVLVMHDMLGINKDFSPKFLRRYEDLHTVITKAVQNYIKDVKERDFPNEQESY